MTDNTTSLFAGELSKVKYDFNLGNHLRYCLKEFKKSPFAIYREQIPLSWRDGKISLQDYFIYRLFDDNNLSWEDKKRFISDRIHWPIHDICCDRSWAGLTVDKWLVTDLLSNAGIPAPQIVAIADSSIQRFPNATKLSSADGLAEFFASTPYPLFAKPMRGLGSFGAMLFTGMVDGKVQRANAEPVEVDRLFKEFISDVPYIFQPLIGIHPDMKKLSDHVCTVRTVNLVERDRVSTPFTILKIPAGGNIADNFWREGNLVADVDPDSGKIRRAVRGKGIFQTVVESDPDTGLKLVGFQLPLWDKLLELNETVARIFAPARYQSLDIALTPDGPVVVEVNSGSSFELPQIATGKGFLTDQIRDFFRSCGWKFSKA